MHDGAPDEADERPLAPGVSAAAHEATLRTRAESREMGTRGQHATDRLVAPLSERGFVVLRDVAVPNSAVSVDHVLIGPTGVFVVESKRWKLDEPVREHKGQLFSGALFRGEEVDRLVWAASKVARHADLHRFPEVRTHAVMCIHAAPFARDFLELDRATVVAPVALDYAIFRPDRALSPALVDDVAAAVMDGLHPKLGGPWPHRALAISD
jgi:hypothetical protein